MPEAEVSKFWEAAQEVLNPERHVLGRNQALAQFAKEYEVAIKDGYSVHMVWAAKAGFDKAALEFQTPRRRTDRQLRLVDGNLVTVACSLELVTEDDLARRFDAYRAGFRGRSLDVTLRLEPGLAYTVEIAGRRSLRATIKASEIIRIFNLPSMGYRLFTLNPRGPLANAKVNKSIARTLDTPEGRRSFHLLNNGLCATCSDFTWNEQQAEIKNFQIVNGCQTTVTLKERSEEELSETLVDLKLAIGDVAFAETIAVASNTQNALRARDFASFEIQQRQLAFEFERLTPPWYYEIKQGYWRFVLDDREKARFKTGRRKRHIEVQPLAQASLAFLGQPAEALDRIRFVFEAIQSDGEHEAYQRAFPAGVKASHLLLPWLILDYLVHNPADRPKYSTLHVLWLAASVLRNHYSLPSGFFSVETTARLIASKDEWLPPLVSLASRACDSAIRRTLFIMGQEDIDLRQFFRTSGDLATGVTPTELLERAVIHELDEASKGGTDPRSRLPA